MSKEDIGVVHAYIMATKTHQMSQSPEVDDDLALFLDIDMSILGQPREIYMRYAGAIRAEYKHVPRSLYLEKRAQILSSFIEGGEKYIKGGRQTLRREIYASQFYKNELEEQARDNIAGEIYMLRRGIIPYEEKER
ncbi:hypothetical protein NSK_001703 [Nannochloropsis salina CCMP1776]|uniref:Uncharacterized protein n=1 Tax=Nannochloropsis salina CCMP1776 TaxID=1027361 RepID=A0A4D9D6N9_9STRA|nr:hypothetical protein NSK_001703 [Nannochloropsis salina CCMP1776]|eukprot:TFJ87371.1 hypothetical protein NSK_001703 [Nannochloropsis salina CCMP1776]